MTSQRGFTLVEVMVAMIILAVGITSAMRALNTSIDAGAQARDRVLAATLARQVMTETLAEARVSGDLPTGTNSGDFGEDYPRFEWETVVDQADLEYELLQLTVTVRWSSGPASSRQTLTTLYLPPADTTTVETTTEEGAGGGGAGGGGGGSGG